MTSIRGFVRQHRFSTFIALTLALTWIPWLTVVWLLRTGGSTSVSTLVLLGGFGPLLAALLVAVVGGDTRSWLRNLVDVRAPVRVWAAAILVPIGLYVVAIGLFVLAGGEFNSTTVVPAAAIPAIVFATFIRGGLEEPGWRGMALPVLQRRIGAFQASLVIGVIWALWHVPLFMMPGSSQSGTPFLLYAGFVVGVSVIATWLYNAAGGRVLVPVVFHTLSNAVSVTTATGVIGDGVASQVALLAIVWVSVGVLVWRYDLQRLSPNPLPNGGLEFPAPASPTTSVDETSGIVTDEYSG
jgi:membrane protease YdiL (CAAX protease family)